MVNFAPIPMLAKSNVIDGSPRICESGDDVVLLESSERILTAPQYFVQGYRHAEPCIRLRTSAINALHRAVTAIPSHYKLLIWDGLRSLDLQREIRHVAIRNLVKQRVTLTNAELSCYVSDTPLNSAQFDQAPPPHCTGGAVDVSLAYADGRNVDMGADFDEFNERAWLRFYESNSSSLHDGSSTIVNDGSPQHARRILYHAMTHGGFAPYEYEFWHYEIGTVRAAQHSGSRAASHGAAVSWTQNGENNEA